MGASDLKPVYLVTGNDQPKVELALRRLRARFEAGSVDVYPAESCSGLEATAATNALGLFGGGERLVVVEHVERWKKADVEAIAAYASSPTPGAVLALRCDPERLPAGLVDAVTRSGEVLRYDVPTVKGARKERTDFARWVQAQFGQIGVQVDHATSQRLLEIVGEDTFALRAEVEKLAAWAAGQPIGTLEVEQLAVPGQGTSDWALGDSWGARDLTAALDACEASLGAEEPFVLAARLGRQVTGVRAVQALLDRDLGTREIASRLEMRFEWMVRKQAGQAGNYSAQELADAVIRMADLDYRIKGGTRVDPELELERAIVDITTPTEHRPG
jgi:DNA polymerase-3 subunit delta